MNGTKDKQLKERFLFVINKIDKTFDDIEKNLELHLQDVINKIAEPLKNFGIENPNIFSNCSISFPRISSQRLTDSILTRVASNSLTNSSILLLVEKKISKKEIGRASCRERV